jgi:ribonucleoside-diphosphate reductase alpha chain/ribonucleoside-triphosphate reductase
MGVRMTLPTLELHEFDLVNKEERLIGCSLTGWQDAVELANLSEQDQINLLRRLRDVAREEADRYANELGINSPLLATTIKPSGTLSLLPTVSSGIHRNHSEYYIRRIRVNADDPLAHTVRELGYKWHPEVGQDMENLRTIVVEFPVKGVANNVKSNVSAVQQLKDYLMFMDHYVEHNTSITIHVREHEWDEVEQFVWDNWDKIVAVSFIPYDDSFYQLLPYEECTKEEYLALKRITPKFDPEVLAKYDQGEEFGIDDSECASGVCPIK